MAVGWVLIGKAAPTFAGPLKLTVPPAVSLKGREREEKEEEEAAEKEAKLYNYILRCSS